MSYNEYVVAEGYHVGRGEDRNVAFRYMLRNFSAVHIHANFRHFIDVRTLKCLIASPAVQASPQDRLDAVLGWVGYDETRRRQHLADLLVELPAALIDKGELRRLLRQDMVKKSSRAQCAVQDMIDSYSAPYWQTENTHALGLSDIRDGGGHKVFCFVTAGGQAEFEVRVEASKCMSHVAYELRCKRVSVSAAHRLPVSVKAHLRVKLCHDHGPHGASDLVRGGSLEEEDVRLVDDGAVVKFRRRVHFDECHMAYHVANKHKIALFVELLQFKVNGGNFDYRSYHVEPAVAAGGGYYWVVPAYQAPAYQAPQPHPCVREDAACEPQYVCQSERKAECKRRCERKCERKCERACRCTHRQNCKTACTRQTQCKWHCESQWKQCYCRKQSSKHSRRC